MITSVWHTVQQSYSVCTRIKRVNMSTLYCNNHNVASSTNRQSTLTPSLTPTRDAIPCECCVSLSSDMRSPAAEVAFQVRDRVASLSLQSEQYSVQVICCKRNAVIHTRCNTNVKYIRSLVRKVLATSKRHTQVVDRHRWGSNALRPSWRLRWKIRVDHHNFSLIVLQAAHMWRY